MKATKLSLLAIAVMVIASGCLTSEEPFYQESDIKVDDRLVGTYVDESDHSKSPTLFYVSRVGDFDHRGQYYITVASKPGCEMKFGAVLFQISTNRFLDMLPQLEACDDVPASPPSLLGLLKSATLQPLHMAVKVEVSTNGVKLDFATHPALVAAATKFPQYFQPLKPGRFPRMIADAKRQREFLLRFGGETNLFKPSELRRETPPSK